MYYIHEFISRTSDEIFRNQLVVTLYRSRMIYPTPAALVALTPPTTQRIHTHTGTHRDIDRQTARQTDTSHTFARCTGCISLFCNSIKTRYEQHSWLLLFVLVVVAAIGATIVALVIGRRRRCCCCCCWCLGPASCG